MPTPLTRNREPDLAPLVDAGTSLARRAAARASWWCSSRPPIPGTTRERLRAAARGVRAGRRARLPRRLLARARRPGPHRLHAAQHAQGRRRADATACRAARASSCTARSATTSCAVSAPEAGRADEAARERLPLGEHRARQRAGDAVRPDGHRHLGGRRRRGHQAVRLHALRARARAWAATACRSTRSTWPGARASSTCRPSSSSWPARSTRRCRTSASSKIARALNDHAKAVRGSRIAMLGVSYKAGVGDLRESPALKIMRLLREPRRRRRLPRRRTCRRCREFGAQLASRSTPALDGADVRRDRHRAPGRGHRAAGRADAPLVVDFRGVTRGIEADNLVRL